MGLPLSSLPLSQRVSLSRNEFIDHTPIYRSQPRLQSKMASHSLRSPISFRGTSHPISTAQPWQSSVPDVMRARQKFSHVSGSHSKYLVQRAKVQKAKARSRGMTASKCATCTSWLRLEEGGQGKRKRPHIDQYEWWALKRCWQGIWWSARICSSICRGVHVDGRF